MCLRLHFLEENYVPIPRKSDSSPNAVAVDAAGCGVDRDRAFVSMLDFLRYAAAFFFFGQQYYEWRERV